MQRLSAEESSELQTQINLFYEHKDLDAEEFSHRYDNIRLLMEYLFPDFVDRSLLMLLCCVVKKVSCVKNCNECSSVTDALLALCLLSSMMKMVAENVLIVVDLLSSCCFVVSCIVLNSV